MSFIKLFPWRLDRVAHAQNGYNPLGTSVYCMTLSFVVQVQRTGEI
jgi:hypothetical protein